MKSSLSRRVTISRDQPAEVSLGNWLVEAAKFSEEPNTMKKIALLISDNLLPNVEGGRPDRFELVEEVGKLLSLIHI